MTETSTGSGPTVAVGTYPIVPSNATFSAGLRSNYTITYANGTLTVNPAGLAITVTYTTNPSVYGQSVTFTTTVAANPPGAGIPTGTVQFQIDGTNFGSLVTLVNGNATSGTTSAFPAGSHSIQAKYSGDANFIPGTGTLTQTVNPEPLSVTANNATKTYGQTMSFAGSAFTMTGLVNGDTVSSVTETSTGSGPTAAAGTYTIVPSNATFSAGLNSNYTITYANGTLTVNPTNLTDTAGQPLTVTLQGSGPSGHTLTYSASAETLTYWLEQTYGFYEDPGGYYTGYRGQQEEYLRAKVSANGYNTGGIDPWYYILPNGDLYEFTPPYTNPALTGVLVAQLGTAVYNDPSLLWNAPEHRGAGDADGLGQPVDDHARRQLLRHVRGHRRRQ